jgi:hypothetical protein
MKFTNKIIAVIIGIGISGLVALADTTATAPENSSAIMSLPGSGENKFVDSNGSLIDKHGNRIGLNGQPEPTLKKDTDKNGNQLDQNGVPISNGLSSRVVAPKQDNGK